MSTAETFTVSQPRVAAGALFLDSSGQVLLVKPSYKPLWDIPGGYVEPGETPRQACVREVAEELGLARTIGRPLVIDWAPASGEGDKLLFVFEGGVLTREDLAKVTLQTEELEQVRFFSPASFAEVLTDRLSRRIAAAVHAASVGDTTYLEPLTQPTSV